ncbi:hypothetical protein K2173_026747 [Erythroxylum novogranatense]|uniref:Isopenicillin N synthase-like Fe(2+) 2OG dioxygenase domain-containing protein n=1 Tax=Erythroxylum novogranatense TaxID=1862640 RepID=A0AAV8U0G4_9ROSI|nr:hypothetical protein K2173_026747 [Erythroxylum novogranatense]
MQRQNPNMTSTAEGKSSLEDMLQTLTTNTLTSIKRVPKRSSFDCWQMFQVLSNGKYKSVLHRSVVNKEKVRMSWAVFIAPPQEAMIGPFPELLDAQNTPKFSTKTFSEYRYRKVNKLPQLTECLVAKIEINPFA